MEYVFQGQHHFTTKIGGVEVELTRILDSKLLDPKSNHYEWVHTESSLRDTHTLETVMNEVDRLSDDLINKGNSSKQETMEQLANIAWLQFQAMPTERGAALATNMHIQSLALAKGVKLPAWRKGILPDCEALTMSKEDYVKSFTSMFESRP